MELLESISSIIDWLKNKLLSSKLLFVSFYFNKIEILPFEEQTNNPFEKGTIKFIIQSSIDPNILLIIFEN